MTVPAGLAGIEKLQNFVADPDVGLLDRVLDVFYRGSPQERAIAQPILTRLQEDPNAWQRVDTILEYSRSQSTKFYALQILESLIKFRWKILPREQCQAIKTYIVGLVIKLSQTDELLQREKLVLAKLNDVLVQVVKQEWPRNWESFIPELVASSATSESICENNVQILKLLSEEIFDFSSGQMTQMKILELKNSFNKEFALIYKLLEHILNNSQKPSLVLVSLQTLLRFLGWIPLGYIFETKMVDTLLFKFFTAPMFRNVTLKCLTEIGSLSVGNLHDAHFARLFAMLMTQLRNIIPVTADIAAAYEHGTRDQQDFLADLSMFFTGFFKAHLAIVETPEYQQLNLEAHSYVAKLTLVSEVEVFKICLEYWHVLAADLYNESPFMMNNTSGRRGLYAPILSQVRLALIGRMAKPEEVLIVEDEGEIIREVSKDVDAIILYKSMKETLVYLTNLSCEDTQRIMLDKLQRQVNGTEWSWHNLNTLCWAVGSISGAMSEDDEKKFLVTVIKDLLGLCEMKKGKDNKAVVASNIMYIVGQYPRFLRAHWKFLRTVVNKLIEFMHELHPGVQDMAVETYCKIAQKCRRKFVVTQPGEAYPFVEEILETLQNIISDLQPAQIHTFYEATGYMISAQTDPRTRDALILKLMALPNQSWAEMMAQANHTIDYLRNAETAKSITNILKTNTHAAQSLGHCFVVQLGRIFMDLLNVYRVYSETISTQVATGGQYAAQSSVVRSMRFVKKETLRLLEAFISKSDDPKFVYTSFVPPLLNAVLGDYKMIIPETRDAEVLSLLTAVVTKLKGVVLQDVPRILDHVFEATLVMITRNFEDFPDIRVQFFNLLRAINQYCFQAFFLIPQTHFKLVIDSVVWAFKHPTRNIAEIGVNILLELWKNISQSEVAQAFYQAYFLSLLQDILFVLTDTFHKSAFKLHALILLNMFNAVQSGQVTAPLWEAAKVQVPPGTDNRAFLREYVVNLLASGFKNLTPQQLQGFVNGLFSLSSDLAAFKNHIRDFLVLMREFSSGDNSELFLDEEEATRQAAAESHRKKMLAIPGMIAPQDHPGFDDMS